MVVTVVVFAGIVQLVKIHITGEEGEAGAGEGEGGTMTPNRAGKESKIKAERSCLQTVVETMKP
jgi:hypothetical protein